MRVVAAFLKLFSVECFSQSVLFEGLRRQCIVSLVEDMVLLFPPLM